MKREPQSPSGSPSRQEDERSERSASIPREKGRRWADGRLKKSQKEKRGEEREKSYSVAQRKTKKKYKKEKKASRLEVW